MVLSLQLQCLYFVVGRLEEYSLQTVSLLPSSLRRQLLLRLPVADICRLEEDHLFMSALDPDSIWRGVFDERLLSLFPRLSNTLGGHSSAKDRYLSEVAQCLFTTNY